MSKYLGVIIGAAVLLIGVRALVCWWPDLLTVLRGSVPALLLLAGAIAVIAGLSEIRDEFSSKK